MRSLLLALLLPAAAQAGPLTGLGSLRKPSEDEKKPEDDGDGDA